MRIKLKLLNETRYSTRDLRRLFLAGMKAIGATQPKTVRVTYARIGSGIGGRAVYGQQLEHGGTIEGRQVWLYLDRGGSHKPVDLGVTIYHELLHSLGWRHRQMAPDSSFPLDWVDGLPLRFTEPAKRTRAEIAAGLVAKRDARARARVAQLEAEIVRKQKLLRKWRDKVRYYDKRAAAQKAKP